jgi:1-aminocyclopropane-1-carboxylate deaminase
MWIVSNIKSDIFRQIFNPKYCLLSYSATPVLEIQNPAVTRAGVKLFIKREDLNHPLVSGNKWWKLKYNLAEAINTNKHTLLTFGGAYSNHIYATAAAARELSLNAIGIIRGEEHLSINPIIQFARDAGMQLHFVSRELYRQKNTDGFLQQLAKDFGDCYVIPEGGSNELAVKGVTEFAGSLRGNDFDYACCPVGTGGTLAGLINGFKGAAMVVGISVLKNGTFLNDEVRQLGAYNDNWMIRTEYDFGGYAKSTPRLSAFINDFWKSFGIPVEPVYSGKLMAAIFDLLDKGFFKRGSRVLAIHTGGIH